MTLITVVGEALIDLVAAPGATDLETMPGGGPANIAVGLARLGCRTTLLTQLGDDAHGRVVRTHLESNGVDVALVGPADARTSTALASLDGHGVASYDFDITWQARDLRLPPAAEALHVGSLGIALEPGAAHVTTLVERVSGAGRALVSFDPNPRPSITPDPGVLAGRVEHLAALSDIVKLSTEDLEFLFPGASPDVLARRWLHASSRTRLVVITAGGDGCFAVTPEQWLHVPAYATEVVDTVGAGDAFMSGLLATLANHDALSPSGLARAVAARHDVLTESLRAATAAAAITCSRPGADPPTTQELRDFAVRV